MASLGKALLWTVVLWLALLTVSVSIAKAEFEQYEPVAVQTTCPAQWDDGRIWGYTRIDIPGWPVYLSPFVCNTLRAGPSDRQFPNAVAVLYHEWVHSYFETTNEGDAECVSLFFLRYELRHAWGLTPKEAQRAYVVAWRTHLARAVLYPQYRGVCGFPQNDPVP